MYPGLAWNGNEILRPRHPVFKTARWRVNDSIWLFFWVEGLCFSSPQEAPNRSKQRRRICLRLLDPNRHRRDEIVGDRKYSQIHPVLRHQQPPRESLLYIVESIARRG